MKHEPVICVSIKDNDFLRCKGILKDAPMAEIRADLCGLSVQQVGELVSGHDNILITCRIENGSEDITREYFRSALSNGARYADVETEAPAGFMDEIREMAHSHGAKFIVSYHNFTCTPPLEELEGIARECMEKGADIVKVVTTAHSTEDGARVLQLYRSELFSGRKDALVAFAMGESGRFTRYLCLSLGAPYTYVAQDPDNGGQPDGSTATAPGQYTVSQMRALLQEGTYVFPDSISRADISIPCSKSVAQRAVIAAMLSEGTSILRNYEPCNDIEDALRIAGELGCEVEKKGEGTVCITSPGASNLKERFGRHTIMTGESGLLTRLMIPVSAYFSADRQIEITGRGSLLKRNLSEAQTALQAAGTKCTSRDGYLPFRISGGIRQERITFSGASSSQVVSGFLMTLPLLESRPVLEIQNPTSIPYIRLTLDILEKFGIHYDVRTTAGTMICSLSEGSGYRATDIYLEADWSSAAFFAVAFAIKAAAMARAGQTGAAADRACPTFRLDHMPAGSSQADEAVLEVLRLTGTRVNVSGESITVSSDGTLDAFTFDADNSPDLFPILAVLACFCNGTSRIKGVHRLYQKESNRCESIFTELTALGAEIAFDDDAMTIKGRPVEERPLHGGNVHSHNDHRIAMSLAVAALFIKEPVKIDDVRCIGKSFPTFLEKLKES